MNFETNYLEAWEGAPIRTLPTFLSENKMNSRKQYMKDWYKTIPEKQRVNLRRRSVVGRFRTTPEWYDKKLKEQHGHCALCKAQQGDAKKRLHIDHNHACCPEPITQKRACGQCNRGLLCGNCNRKLSYLELILKQATMVVPKWDTWLENALLYLTRYGCR